VGVLFRTHDRKATFENALRNHGVRYASVKGVGFFQSQPVFDAINLLRFLFDAHDSLALAGVLRSPLIGVSDLALLELRRVQSGRGRELLWAALSVRCDELEPSEYSLPQADERALRDGWRRLKSWREKTKTELVSAVLETIWSESDLAFSESLQLDAMQRKQNWRKVLDIVRAREERGRGSARALAEYFMTQASDENNEADAELPEGGSIQLMTVFAAKGLGFDMTIVAQMDGTFRLDTPLMRNGALENRDEVFYALKLNRESESETQSVLWTILADEDRARKEAEFARLFYVACTRARDFLVLAVPSQIKKASWAEMAQSLLADKTHFYLPQLRERAKERESTILNFSAGEIALQNTPSKVEIDAALLEPLAPQLGRETSVTQWLKWTRDKELSRRSTPAVGSSASEKMQQATFDPRVHGQVFHRLLRLVLEKRAVGEFELSDGIIANFCRSSNLNLARVGVLRRQISAALTWLEMEQFDISRARCEFGFSIPVEKVREGFPEISSETQWLNGVIDLLIPKKDEWQIIDFKTYENWSSVDEALETYGYDQQLRLYQKACEYSGLEIVAARLVFVDKAGRIEARGV